jgi:sugar lactone lactonase YvrE
MPDNNDLHDLLVQVADQVVPTDLLPTVKRRVRVKTQRRIMLAVASTVVAVAAGAYGAAHLASGDRQAPPIHHPHPTTVVTPHLHSHTFGPTTTSTTSRVATTNTAGGNGPGVLGVAAFGDIWATGGGHSVTGGILYRLSPDGARELSQTPYPDLNTNQGGGGPVRIGHAIVVADGADSFYTVFNQTGRKIGRLPNGSLGAMAGDAAGGWVTTKPDQVARIDVTGLHIVQRLHLPVAAIGGLAMSPGQLWVIDPTDNQLLRVSTETGSVTGRLHLPASPTQVAFTDGAVYVAAQDHGLRRIDPTTMTVTASTFSAPAQAVPVIAEAPNGHLWAQADQGSVAQLDPSSLRTERNIRVYVDTTRQADGAVVTADRVFVTNGTSEELYSFPLH